MWSEPDRDNRRVGIAFGTIGVVMLVCSALFYSSVFRLESEGATAVGTVVDFRTVEYQRDRYSGRPYKDGILPIYDKYLEPIIQFTSGDGRVVRFNGVGAPREGVSLGDTFNVVYLPSNPWSSAELGEMPRLWNGVIACGILGLACLVPFFVLVRGPAPAWLRRPLLLALVHVRGKSVEARVASVRHIRRRGIPADHHSIEIEAVWRDPQLGRTYHFRSDPIPVDLRDFAQRNGLPSWEDHSKRMVAELHHKLRGRPVAVRVNPRFPGIYVMDPPALPR